MNAQTDIELSQYLTRTSRKIKSLKATLPIEPSEPAHFVLRAGIEAELADLEAEQLAAGKELLRRDELTRARKLKQLEKTAATGAESAAELLDRLPAFAGRLDETFKLVSSEYHDLLVLASHVRQTNTQLLNARLPQHTPAAIKIEPAAMRKMMEMVFQKYFTGDKTTDFEIINEVADIQKACAGKEAYSE